MESFAFIWKNISICSNRTPSEYICYLLDMLILVLRNEDKWYTSENIDEREKEAMNKEVVMIWIEIV